MYNTITDSNIMDEYRKAASEKYYKKQEEDRRKQEELDRIEKEKQDELRREEIRQEEWRQEQMQMLLQSWDNLVQRFPISMDAINELRNHVHAVFPLFQEYGREEDIQQRMIQLVETINTQHEVMPHSMDNIRHVHDVMKSMLETCQVDIPIEVMDVSQDETVAQRMQEELFYEDHIVAEIQDIPQVPDVLNTLDIPKPLCSFTKRIGLTIIQLKELARFHQLSPYGTKEELCKRLERNGLVYIV